MNTSPVPQMPQADPGVVASLTATALQHEDVVLLRLSSPVNVMAAARELGYHGEPFGIVGQTIRVRRA